MPHRAKTGAIAAFTYAGAALATFGVALFWIGPAAIIDQSKLIELASSNPTPLIVQDLLKFTLAVSFTVLLVALFRRLQVRAPRLNRIAAVCGLLSALTLVLNGVLSLLALSLTSSELRLKLVVFIAILGFCTLILNGIWYLLVNWSALRQMQFPRGVSYLGIAIGVLNLIPIFGLLALVCSIVWSVLVGKAFMSEKWES